MHNSTTSNDGEMNLVEIWLRKDPIRWVAGALAGAFAAALMMVCAAIIYKAFGGDALFPIKMAAIPVIGARATEFASQSGLITGVIVYEVLGAILGIFYAHFTGTNQLGTLLGAGLVWGVFSWIFINNLFIQAFAEVFATQSSYAAAFPANLVFGLSLTSVAFFDRMLRGRG